MSEEEIDIAAASDDAPSCSEPGCRRLGVVFQTVTTTRGTQTWHWCLLHDPER